MKTHGKFAAIVLLLLAFSIINNGYAKACSAFTLKTNTDAIAAKSYDWNVGVGAVLSNPRGERLSLPMGFAPPISWEARFGSITFNQYGQFLPNGGINEAGLVIEVLWLEETYYPESRDKMLINELQWVQYHLDVCQSVDEVIASSLNFNIVPIFGKLHYFIADKTGNTAVIQFLDGEVKFFSGESLPCKAITNDTYANSINYFNNSEITGGRNASLNRFFRVAESLNNSAVEKDKNNSTTDEAFNLLSEVWVKGWTKWNTVYNMSKGIIYFKSDVSRSIKNIDLNDFDFTSNAVPLHVNINNFLSGNIHEFFTPFSMEANFELMLNSITLTGVPISENQIRLLASYPENKEDVEELMAERTQNTGTLVVNISGLKKNGGVINLGLFDSTEGFDKQRPFNGGRIRGAKGTVTYVFYNVPLNRHYAVGFYHDENSNGRLDRSRLGLPREPYGFSGRGRKFETAKFFFNEQKIVISVKPR